MFDNKYKTLFTPFSGLLSFSSSLEHVAEVSDQTKCLSLNDEPCMVRPTIIDLNPLELKYYSLMVSLDKCSGSCNSGNDLSSQICVLSKTKDINVKAFNIITRINEAKTLVKHISCDCICNFNSTTCSSNKWNRKTCQ